MTSPIKLNTSGSFEIKRHPEFCTLSLYVHANGSNKEAVYETVVKAANSLAETFKPLAPPRADDDQTLEVDDETRNPQYMVTKWKMQSLQTWSRDQSDDNGPWPQLYPRSYSQQYPQVMMAAATSKPGSPKITHTARQTASATFHDFEGMKEIIGKIMQMEHVEVSGLHWGVTKATEQQLQTRVRQGAYKDAYATAVDLATVISGKTPQPLTVNCSGHGGGGGHRMHPAQAMFSDSSAKRQAPPISFEPEAISVYGDVNVEWALDL